MKKVNDRHTINGFQTITVDNRESLYQFLNQQLFVNSGLGFSDGLAGTIARTSVQPDQGFAISRTVIEDNLFSTTEDTDR